MFSKEERNVFDKIARANEEPRGVFAFALDKEKGMQTYYIYSEKIGPINAVGILEIMKSMQLDLAKYKLKKRKI